MVLIRTRVYLSLAIAILTGWFAGPAAAYDRIGTAGPIRTFGGAQCAKSAWKGECDPPVVDASLPTKQKTAAHLARARGLIAVFRHLKAVEELDAALAEDPGADSARLLRARLWISSQTNDALHEVEFLIGHDPSNADALATRAFLLSGERDDLALEDATKAISLRPDDVDAFCIRAKILARLDKPDEAERDLTKALAIEPDNPDALLSRAELRLARGDPAQAEKDAENALSSRNDMRGRQARAVARVRQGKYDAALEDLNTILGSPDAKVMVSPIAPQFVDLLVQRALVLSRIGRPNDAKSDLSTILSLGGQRAILQMQLYLRGHGFRDAALNGKPSDQLNDDLVACFLNDACGKELTLKM